MPALYLDDHFLGDSAFVVDEINLAIEARVRATRSTDGVAAAQVLKRLPLIPA